MKQALIKALIAVFFLGVFVAGRAPTMDAAAAATQPARAINTLSAYQRLHLPDSTRVYIFKRRVTTLGALRAAHLALEHSRANAMARGWRVALLIRTKHFRVFGKTATFADASGKVYALQPVRNKQKNSYRLESTLSNSDVRVGVASTHLLGTPAPMVTSAPGRTGGPWLRPSNVNPSWWLHSFGTKVIAMPQSELQPFAKDYQDFCKAAQATACLYFPAGAGGDSVESVYTFPNSNRWVSTLLVFDPLIYDSAVCQAGNGAMTGSGCQYVYPLQSVTNYAPSSSNPYVANCPGGNTMWTTTVDPHGAAEVNLYGAYYTPILGLASPASCVIQVFSGS